LKDQVEDLKFEEVERLIKSKMKNYFEKNKEENFESIVGGKHQKINSTFHSHRESGFKNPKISGSQRIEVEN
jgi:hypothetical protein